MSEVYQLALFMGLFIGCILALWCILCLANPDCGEE